MRNIMFGAGDDGYRFLQLVGQETIAFIVDNDVKKVGRNIGNIKILSPDALKAQEDFCVIISVSLPYQNEIKQQLAELGITNYCTASEFLERYQLKQDERLLKLKGLFDGKRCFIVGAGPSLTVDDLEMLMEHKEICFASNKIFKLFNATKWRPELYCISDMDVFAYYYDTVCDMGIPYEFLVDMRGMKYEKLDLRKMEGGNKYLFKVFKSYKNNCGELLPGFSTQLDKYIVDGGITVTYSMLQIAYYLGFSEVFLLGVDFDYEDKSGMDAKGNDHFCENYNSTDEIINPPKLKESLLAYKVAEQFSKEHNFKIYNATRGGKLDVFQKVRLEDILDGKKHE